VIVAIIPARAGSKRIAGKNIKPFAGKPMLAWPLRAAQQAGIFDRIIVSTEAPHIAAIAKEWGAEVPFMRPAELADDYTGTAPIFLHALDALAAQGASIEYACCIYPTSPFLLADDLRQGFMKLRDTGAPAVIPVTTFSSPILHAFIRSQDDIVAYKWPEHAMLRSQDMPDFFHDAGMFYWVDVARFRELQCILMPGTRALQLPRKRIHDLDTMEDWEAAELAAHAFFQANG